MMTVYLVDDEMWIVLGLKKQIERSGLPFQVAGVSNDGMEAQKEIMRLQPDVVFTDIRMPSVDGLKLLKKIHEAGMKTKTVMISGYAEFDYAKTSIRYGAFEYLLKPIEPDILYQTLKRLQHEIEAERDENEGLARTLEEKILQELQERFTEDISLSGLADKYAVSQSGLSTLIKNKLGISFSEYITARRMMRAKELLADERLSVAAIAESVGYHDYYYFTKVFKKTQGITPSKYRKKL